MVPIFRSVLPHAMSVGHEVLGDVVAGKKFKQSVRKRGLEAISKVASTAAARGGRKKKRRKKRKASKSKRKKATK